MINSVFDAGDADVDHPLRRHVGVASAGMADAGSAGHVAGFGAVDEHDVVVIALHVDGGMFPADDLAVKIADLRSIVYREIMPKDLAM